MKKVAIVGLGALGGPIAVRIFQYLSRDPQAQVIGVTGRQTTADFWSVNGLTVVWQGKKEAPVKIHQVIANASDLPNDLDLVILGIKSDALNEVCNVVKDKLKPDGLLVSLQNGYVIDAVAAIIGASRTASASVVWSATLEADNTYNVTGGGHFNMGGLPEVPKQRLIEAKKLLEQVFEVVLTDNIRGTMWSKMCVNCSVTTMGAITGLTFGQQTERKDLRLFYMENVAEIIRVGRAHGVKFEKLNGKLNPVLLSNFSPWVPNFFKHYIYKTMGKRYYGGVSSMLQSLQKGRPPEIEYINGVVSELGKKYGIPTPKNDAMIKMVREIAAGKRKIGVENLKELLNG